VSNRNARNIPSITQTSIASLYDTDLKYYRWGTFVWLTKVKLYLRASKQVATCLAIAMIALLWGGIYFQLNFERATTLQSASQNASNLSRAFEENVIRSIKEIDNALFYLRNIYQKSEDKTEWSRASSEISGPTGLTLQFSVIGADGILKASNVGTQPPAPIDLSYREHFKFHANSEGDELFIGKPLIGRVSQKWSVQVARRLRKSDGSFDGVMVASLDPEHLAHFYTAIDLGEDGAITLVGTDGVVRAQSGRYAPALGTSVTDTPLFQLHQNSRAGSYAYIDIEGARVLVAYRAVKGFPLIVTISLAEREILARYWQNRRSYFAIGAGLTICILFAVGLSAWHRLRLDRASAALRVSEARDLQLSRQLQITLDNMGQGLCLFDTDKRVVFANNRYAELYGLSLQQMKPGTELRQILEARAAKGFYDHIDAQKFISDAISGFHQQVSEILQLADGRHISVLRRPMADGGLVSTHEDITDRRRIEARMAHMAHHDALTDLPNRVLLHVRLDQALARVPRGENLAVLCLDLDHFKTVNDTLGHQVGDALLQAVAHRLSGCVRDTDTVARFGGDEFAILQVATEDATDIVALARRICEEVRAPYELGEHRVNIGISIGISIAPSDGIVADQLLKNADLALYRAKAEGRGTYRFFEPEMDARMRARRALELDLRKAHVNDEFELFYQPFVNLQSNEICGFEALLRWHHPERGLVSPVEFIPVAEEIGLIVPIGEWVLRQACAEAKSWPENITLAVNLSPNQFTSQTLVQMVFNALATSGLPGSRLELEITESALLQNNAMTLDTVNQLRSLGVRISMDDFGTGYSSLGYLQTFPFDKIKIDRSFINNLSNGHGSVAILKAIISLANGLRMTTIAEGVETQEQLEIVRAEGCTEMQGYLFSPARPAQEIAEILMREASGVERAA
jgi:diguanylate cyclase (GGDEF)-like protein